MVATDPKPTFAVWQNLRLLSIVVEYKNNKVTCMNPSKSVVSILLLCLSSSIAFAQDKPNIVLVFLDNFGWESPDSMAAE